MCWMEEGGIVMARDRLTAEGHTLITQKLLVVEAQLSTARTHLLRTDAALNYTTSHRTTQTHITKMAATMTRPMGAMQVGHAIASTIRCPIRVVVFPHLLYPQLLILSSVRLPVPA